MRLPKRYLIRVVKKRLIEFILMISVINIVLFGVYMAGAKSGTGILYQLGNDWYIDNIGIRNPHSFPHVLIPENNGKEVHYIHFTEDLYMDIYSLGIFLPFFVNFFTIDLVPVFKIKQSILYNLFIFIAISSIVVFTYLYLNRKRFPLTNKLLG